MAMNARSETGWGDAGVALLCGAIILALSLGIRHAFGLFLQPVSLDLGWGAARSRSRSRCKTSSGARASRSPA